MLIKSYTIMKKVYAIMFCCLACCTFIQCQDDSHVIEIKAKVLSETIIAIDPTSLKEVEYMQILEESSSSITTLYLNAIEGFNYEKGYEYELLLQKAQGEEYIVDASEFKYKLLSIISKMKIR